MLHGRAGMARSIATIRAFRVFVSMGLVPIGRQSKPDCDNARARKHDGECEWQADGDGRWRVAVASDDWVEESWKRRAGSVARSTTGIGESEWKRIAPTQKKMVTLIRGHTPRDDHVDLGSQMHHP